ncbi:hypothetical protein Droror1_Dr00017240 [Drosera rotundifolia]
MEEVKSKVRVGIVVAVTVYIAFVGIGGVLRPVRNGCVMTYMYPTYILVKGPENASWTKYGIYLYHEGWKKIDFDEHLKMLSGVPVLFIPGNGGSYKQVRSLAKESHLAYSTGSMERTFYQEASLTHKERGLDMDSSFSLPNQYPAMLNWFAVDLEGEHSAMDGHTLQEHTDYVVYAIHSILDRYKESHDARARENVVVSGDLPRSVILVGHSMGGFVARAAVVHPHLRKHVVQTIITLSSPHQSPPVALQPSLGSYFAYVNGQWRKGYQVPVSGAANYEPDAFLSHVVVISISGGANDYQVRSHLATLDGIVPPTNGFTISSTGMRNVWLSMEHQTILWCNQLVVQVSHTILSLLDRETAQPSHGRQRRLAIFAKMLRNSLPQNLDWIAESSQLSSHTNGFERASGSQAYSPFGCPKNVRWSDDGFERDLYIEKPTFAVLAMDGRRRWLDIMKLGSNGKSYFVLVTNLVPCSGVRIHLWSERVNTSSDDPLSRRVIEVTSKLIQVPSGAAPKQVEPGSQTEQPPPSAIFWISPGDMEGFRFISVSVAPRPTVSGRPPPAASMAVGQFLDPKEVGKEFSPLAFIFSAYSQKDIVLKEDHPLVLNLVFGISLGLLPVKFSLSTASCGIKDSGLPSGDVGGLCKLRCFPPVLLAWDATSGLHVHPSFHSDTIIVDSAPAFWSSLPGPEKTTVMLLVDPHCAYKMSYSISLTDGASRFLLLYSFQMLGFCIAIVFFALMRQARAWELDIPVTSMLTAAEYNLRLPMPFVLVAVVPIFISLFISLLNSQPFPPLPSFLAVSLSCYMVANGIIVLLILLSQLIFYVATVLCVFFKRRCQTWERSFDNSYWSRATNIFSGFILLKVVRALKLRAGFVKILTAVILVCFVHPALGLSVVTVSHALCCHNALSSYVTASLRNHRKRKESNPEAKGLGDSDVHMPQKSLSATEKSCSSSSDLAKSYGDIQLENFHHSQGLLLLHLLATLMFGPSFVTWVQRIGLRHSFPLFLDSILCIGVILHGIGEPKPDFNFSSFYLPSMPGIEVRLSFIYMVAGYFSFLSGLALTPYRAFYAMAAVGVISFASRVIQRRNREKGEPYHYSRKHSHRR